MRITINGKTFDRGNTPAEKAGARDRINAVLRPRYTSQAKKNARDYARSNR